MTLRKLNSGRAGWSISNSLWIRLTTTWNSPGNIFMIKKQFATGTIIILNRHRRNFKFKIENNVPHPEKDLDDETCYGYNHTPHNLSGSFSILHSFTDTVLSTEASNWNPTPEGTQPSHDIVWSVVGLVFVSLELEKSGSPRPRRKIFAPPLRKLLWGLAGKGWWNHLRFTLCSCIQAGKVYQGGGEIMDLGERRRYRLEKCA